MSVFKKHWKTNNMPKRSDSFSYLKNFSGNAVCHKVSYTKKKQKKTNKKKNRKKQKKNKAQQNIA